MHRGEAFAGYDRLLSFSMILLVVGFGLVVTDLLGWTYTTHFARIERARVTFFFIALSCFVVSVAVGVTMAGYRDLILGMGQTDVTAVETTATLQGLQTIILLSLAALLFIGALFAFMSFDTFFSAILAGLAVVSGVGLGIVYLLLGMVDLMAAVILVVVKTLRETLAPLTNVFQEGMQSVKAGGGTVLAKLRGLVAPRETAKSVTTNKELLVSFFPEQSINGEIFQTKKQAEKQTVNGYDAHA